MENKVYYSGGGVEVTSTFVKMFGKNMVLRNINEVSIFEFTPTTPAYLGLLFLSFISFVIGIGGAIFEPGFFALIVVGGILMVLALKTLKKHYGVNVNNNITAMNALQLYNSKQIYAPEMQEEAVRIVDAINEALLDLQRSTTEQAPQSSNTQTSATSGSVYDKINELKKLLDDGLISQEQFEAGKTKMLGL